MKTWFFDFETVDPNIGRQSTKTEIGISARCDDVHPFLIALTDGEEWHTFSLDSNGSHERTLCQLLDGQHLVCHNANYDIPFLLEMDVKPGKITDTMTLAALHYSQEKSYSLSSLATKYLKEEKMDMPGLMEGREVWAKYCKKDVELTKKLYEFFMEKLKDRKEVVALEQSVARVAVHMSYRGIRVDVPRLEKLEKELTKSITGKTLKIIDEYGIRQPNSPDLVSKYLGVESSGADALEFYENEDPKKVECARDILEYRKRIKRKEMVSSLLVKRIGNYLYPNFRPMKGEAFANSDTKGTSARFSCVSPNMQQLEKRGDTSIRECILSRHPDEILYMFDYSAQEILIFIDCAYESLSAPQRSAGGEFSLNSLIERFQSDDFDFYNYLGEEGHKILGREAYDPQKHRSLWKQVVLAKLYCIGVAKMAKRLNTTEDSARQIIGAFNKVLPFYYKCFNKWRDEMRAKGYIETMFGHRMYRPAHKQDADYIATNYLVQGSAAGQTKHAMALMLEKGIGPYLQIHDELIISTDNVDVARDAYKIMKNAVKLVVPVRLGFTISNTLAG